jgi:protein-tyrosine-phosphatase
MTAAPDTGHVFNVLFLCTANSARSILAEQLLNGAGQGRFRAFSAGSHPGGRVNPLALEYLQAQGLPTAGLRSKSWDEFAQPGVPPLDFIITVCDNAAGEICPVWPGRPISAHWGVPDPAAVEGTDDVRRRAFADAARVLRHRIALLVGLPLATLDRSALQQQLRSIGASSPS